MRPSFASVLSLSVPGLQESLRENRLVLPFRLHSLVLGRVAVFFLLGDAGTVDNHQRCLHINKDSALEMVKMVDLACRDSMHGALLMDVHTRRLVSEEWRE